jgi:hypothetical protein
MSIGQTCHLLLGNYHHQMLYSHDLHDPQKTLHFYDPLVFLSMPGRYVLYLTGVLVYNERPLYLVVSRGAYSESVER